LYDLHVNPEIQLSSHSLQQFRSCVYGYADYKNIEKRINPRAFYLITEILCIKSPNPVREACEATKISKENAKNAFKNSKYIVGREWQEVTENCEARAIKYLEISSKIVSNDEGDDFGTLMHNLLWDIPDKTLEVNSEKIAAHETIVDMLQLRWNTVYTNNCLGLTTCFPKKTWGIFSTPKCSFWLNFLVYTIFLALSTYLITVTDGGQYEFNTILMDQLLSVDDPDSVSFEEIDDTESFWKWTHSVLGNQVFERTNETNKPMMIGELTIRQFRVKSENCSNDIYSGVCYPQLSNDIFLTNWEKGGSWKGIQWNDDIGIPFFGTNYGVFNYYPSGGYSVILQNNQSEVRETLLRLENDSWIDIQTRAIAIELVLYNPNMKFYGISALFVEWSARGAVIPSHFVFVLPYGNFADNIAFNLIQVLVILTTVGYILQEIYEFYMEDDKIAHLRNILNWLDFLLFTFYLVVNLCHYFISSWDLQETGFPNLLICGYSIFLNLVFRLFSLCVCI